MAKINVEQIVAELTQRMGAKLEKDLVRFNLDPDGVATAQTIGENYAASNIGLSNAEDLDCLGAEEYPEGEIEAWIIRAKRAIALCVKYKLPVTNRNVVLMHWHKGVI